jgi:hypothetical protein
MNYFTDCFSRWRSLHLLLQFCRHDLIFSIWLLEVLVVKCLKEKSDPLRL